MNLLLVTEWAVWDLFPPEIAVHHTPPELKSLGTASTEFTLVIANQQLPRYFKSIWSKGKQVIISFGDVFEI